MTSRQTASIFLLAAAGIALRMTMMGRSYWFDEIATMVNVDAPNVRRVLEITSHDNQPPLYNVVLFGWTRLVGAAEVPVRCLSLLIGLATLATPWLARRSLSRDERWVAFAILALMALPIRYSQEARNYCVLLALSASCLFAYFELLHRESRALRIFFYLALTLLAFSHLFGLLLAMCFLAVVFLRGSGVLPRVVTAIYGLALAVAVMVPLIKGGAAENAGGNFWITFTALGLLKQLLIVFTPVGLLMGVYAGFVWRGRSRPRQLDLPLLWSVVPFVLMLMGAIVISLHTPILTDRNLIGLVAAFALVIARLTAPAVARGAAGILVALLALLLVQDVALIFTGRLFIREDFRAVAERSIAAHEKVCYLVPNGKAKTWQLVNRFYVDSLLHHPDLEPSTFDRAEAPQVPEHSTCHYWSDPHPELAVSVLRTLPQFHDCKDVDLPGAQARTTSVLMSCY